MGKSSGEPGEGAGEGQAAALCSVQGHQGKSESLLSWKPDDAETTQKLVVKREAHPGQAGAPSSPPEAPPRAPPSHTGNHHPGFLRSVKIQLTIKLRIKKGILFQTEDSNPGSRFSEALSTALHARSPRHSHTHFRDKGSYVKRTCWYPA